VGVSLRLGWVLCRGKTPPEANTVWEAYPNAVTSIYDGSVITRLGHKPESGLVVIGDSFLVSHRKPIILAAAQNKVPAVYFHAAFARDGGLLSYGPDNADIFRRAASYVDRIFRGASPAELPVQVPIKFETVVNLKTAKALGLTVPLTLQVAAVEVIE
jgi:putative ABC transport system substrate-binding protein